MAQNHGTQHIPQVPELLILSHGPASLSPILMLSVHVRNQSGLVWGHQGEDIPCIEVFSV